MSNIDKFHSGAKVQVKSGSNAGKVGVILGPAGLTTLDYYIEIPFKEGLGAHAIQEPEGNLEFYIARSSIPLDELIRGLG